MEWPQMPHRECGSHVMLGIGAPLPTLPMTLNVSLPPSEPHAPPLILERLCLSAPRHCRSESLQILLSCPDHLYKASRPLKLHPPQGSAGGGGAPRAARLYSK